METLKLEDVVKTVDTLLAAGKTPAMWERLKHLSGEALAKEQLKALEGISKGLLDYANTNGIGKELWDEATQEAAIMNGYEWRYIHQGLMHEAIKTVREKHKAQVVRGDFEELGEVVSGTNSRYNNVLTTADKCKMFSDWIKRHRVAGISLTPLGWNSSEKQMEFVGEKLGVDVKTNGNNRVAIRMFLEDHNNKRNGKPYIPTKIAVKNNEVVLLYD